jgi:hypothetical protein
MTDVLFNRRLFASVSRIFAGLALSAILASCSGFDSYAGPAMPGTVIPSIIAQPSPGQTATTQPSIHPVLYVVASEALEIRDGPGEAAANIGYLKRGQTVTIYKTAQAEREYCTTWAKIDRALNRWVCFSRLEKRP